MHGLTQSYPNPSHKTSRRMYFAILADSVQTAGGKRAEVAGVVAMATGVRKERNVPWSGVDGERMAR